MTKKQRSQLMKQIAADGGRASMKKLTKKQRVEKARKAANSRWSKSRFFSTISILSGSNK